jgi:ABC-2 type transport system permease protein
MSRPVSRGAIISSILKKDFVLFTRDRVYVFLTILSVVFIGAIFWLVPDEVDETITLGVTPPVEEMVAEAKDAFAAMGVPEEELAEIDEVDFSEEQEGIVVVEFETAEEMQKVIEGDLEAYKTDDGETVVIEPTPNWFARTWASITGNEEVVDERPEDAERAQVNIGIEFPDGFIEDAAADNKTTVTVYTDAGVPAEVQTAMTSFVRELAFALSGDELPVTIDEEQVVLGEDRVGEQVSFREKMRPMFAFMILLVETFSLASLIALEIGQKTITALLVTPTRLSDVLASKSIYGTVSASIQALIILALMGSFTADNWSMLLVAVILGAMMFTGVGMIIGSRGADFLGTLFYGMLFTIPLLIPAIAALFPGTAAGWVQLIPSYGVMELLLGATAYGASWSDAEMTTSVLISIVWLVVLFGAGLLILRRKVTKL